MNINIIFYPRSHLVLIPGESIWRWAEASFGFCSFSGKNPPKFTLHGNWNAQSLNMLHSSHLWHIKDIKPMHLFEKRLLYSIGLVWGPKGDKAGVQIQTSIYLQKMCAIHIFYYFNIATHLLSNIKISLNLIGIRSLGKG